MESDLKEGGQLKSVITEQSSDQVLPPQEQLVGIQDEHPEGVQEEQPVDVLGGQAVTIQEEPTPTITMDERPGCFSRFGLCAYKCFTRWRLWIRPFLLIAYALAIIVLVPLLFVNCMDQDCTNIQKSQLIGGAFALLALPISFWEMIQHLIHYTKPYLQKHIIRILWMVPIYAFDAWLGLLAPKTSIYMNSLRECYEAYVIYNFMRFLLNYLNSEMDLESNLEMKPQVSHLFPLCCLRDWEMGREFVHKCKHGILQYTVLRPLTTAIAFICEMAGVYGEDEYRAAVAFPYIIVINNVSQFMAMYCLVLFYKANKTELAPMKPLGKFVCIKSVVFFSFFQGVAISILVYTGVLSNVFGTTDKNDIKAISSSLQNFLICIEMFFAAIAHHYCFSYTAYIDLAAEQPNCCTSFLHMWDVSDVRKDFQEHIGVMRNTVRNAMPAKVYRHPGGRSTERAHLLSVSEASGYQSGSGGAEQGSGGGTTEGNGEKPVQAARSAGLCLVAGMEPTTEASSNTDVHSSLLHNQSDDDINTFTDIEKYGAEEMRH